MRLALVAGFEVAARLPLPVEEAGGPVRLPLAFWLEGTVLLGFWGGLALAVRLELGVPLEVAVLFEVAAALLVLVL